jgi:hypothetical protein
MPVLPVYLGLGLVAIYGGGIQQSMSGISPSQIGQQFKFGTIYQINSVDFQVGNSVMFNEQDVVCRLTTQNNLVYTIIQGARLVLTDIPR